MAGLIVAHVIHRHGLNNKTAKEVEAALIDAFPGVTNIAGGYGSGERGVMHANEIIERYQAPVVKFKHNLVIININRTASDRSIYEAVRYAWKIDRRKAEKADYVLAVKQGLIVGAFKAEKWLKATTENFPGTLDVWQGRRGFIGKEAPSQIQEL